MFVIVYYYYRFLTDMNAETMPLISFNYPLYIQGLKYMHGIGLVILKLTENHFFLKIFYISRQILKSVYIVPNNL